ncbi:MAG TPA: DUF58 domain-containing protein [Phycisphaerae bacterium]|nr:DUF58 domain-containing protein [Phycisphaerae bacterium]
MKRRFRLLPRRRPIMGVGFRPTLGGTWFMAGAAMIAVAALDADVNLLVVIFGCCVGALVINAFYGWRTLPLLTLKRIVPETAVAGEAFVIRYVLTNRSRMAVARNLLIEDILPRRAAISRPEIFLPSLPAGTSLTLNATVIARTRGRLPLTSMRISTRFPFHLFVKWVRHDSAQEIIVLPPLARLTGEIKIGAAALDSSGGSGSLGWTRGDEELYGVREYREGDNPRRIHWRRSAGRGRLMVREMAQPRSYQMWCVVNTLIRPHDADQVTRLDAAISAAATTICDALERGGRVGLICNGEPFVVLPPGSGKAFRPRALSELSVRGLNTTDELAGQVHRQTWPARWHAPCLLFGANNDEEMRAAARALTRALGPTTAYVPGTPGFDSLFDWPERPEFVALLTSRGKIERGARRATPGRRSAVVQAIGELRS